MHATSIMRKSRWGPQKVGYIELFTPDATLGTLCKRILMSYARSRARGSTRGKPKEIGSL